MNNRLENADTGSSVRKGDILLAVMFVALSCLFLLPSVFAGEAGSVVISTDGVSSVYDLHSDRLVVIEGVGNVHIENGEVWFTDSTCPDSICEAFGHIRKNGESIVCAPNRLIIRIGGEGEVDGIAG